MQGLEIERQGHLPPQYEYVRGVCVRAHIKEMSDWSMHNHTTYN